VDIGGPYLASLHANNALRRPYDDDISRYMDIGDVVSAEVIAFDRVSGPYLTMKGRGLRKLTEGMILRVSPAKIPRIIGRRGSMINMIKNQLQIQTVVGQNGRIWLRAPSVPILRLAIKAFRMIEEEAHTSRLTDRVQNMLTEEMAEIQGKKSDTPPVEKEDTVIEDEETDEVVEESAEEDIVEETPVEEVPGEEVKSEKEPETVEDEAPEESTTETVKEETEEIEEEEVKE
jgi:exosome complex component RRP4